jgi:hypothetical protein
MIKLGNALVRAQFGGKLAKATLWQGAAVDVFEAVGNYG